MKAILTNIKRNALDDGPGIRTLIFFKGCPLSCVWCQNPETKTMTQEITYDIESCISCLSCQEKCPNGAIDFSLKYPIQIEICDFCGKCIQVCDTSALKFTAFEYEVEELLDEILKDKVFYKNSGGGITLSGGEATMQMKFLNEFLKKVKKHEIHVCLETCGHFAYEQFYELILPYLDLIYFDLKIFDSKDHKRYCGKDNTTILQNFEIILKKEDIELLPRIPLIPEITATEQNLNNWKEYLQKKGIKKIELLPYNPLWVSKISKLGKIREYSRSTWLEKEEKEKIKEIFSTFEYKDF
ncbi:MAG: Glycyl-radical enzyme activating protein family [Promethearchaeota archaeon]|nr:MAG: Glycyl-radical enzyme activating protein family [Candidatus Lokiarchaeota archaeon]